MEELLKRWAAVEPGRCIDHINNEALFLVRRSGDWQIAVMEGRINPDKIQGATQEAIEARRWSWAAGFRAEGGGGMVYWGRVMGYEETAHKPAAALLTAYIAALEALNHARQT